MWTVTKVVILLSLSISGICGQMFISRSDLPYQLCTKVFCVHCWAVFAPVSFMETRIEDHCTATHTHTRSNLTWLESATVGNWQYFQQTQYFMETQGATDVEILCEKQYAGGTQWICNQMFYCCTHEARKILQLFAEIFSKASTHSTPTSVILITFFEE